MSSPQPPRLPNGQPIDPDRFIRPFTFTPPQPLTIEQVTGHAELRDRLWDHMISNLHYDYDYAASVLDDTWNNTIWKRMEEADAFIRAENERIARDKGHVEPYSLDVNAGILLVSLSGSCVACARSESTLKGTMRDALASIKAQEVDRVAKARATDPNFSEQPKLDWLNQVDGHRARITSMEQFAAASQNGTGGFEALHIETVGREIAAAPPGASR